MMAAHRDASVHGLVGSPGLRLAAYRLASSSSRAFTFFMTWNASAT